MMNEVVRDAVATSIVPTIPPIRPDDVDDNSDNNNDNNNDHTATHDAEADALLVDVDVDDDDNEEMEEEDVSMQIERRDKEDSDLVEDCIEKEIESAISITEQAPQSMYITDPYGNKVHKKKLLSDYINKGISLPENDGDDELELNDGGDEQINVRAKKKSMDRERRARSSNRHNNQTDSAVDNIILPEPSIDLHTMIVLTLILVLIGIIQMISVQLLSKQSQHRVTTYQKLYILLYASIKDSEVVVGLNFP